MVVSCQLCAMLSVLFFFMACLTTEQHTVRTVARAALGTVLTEKIRNAVLCSALLTNGKGSRLEKKPPEFPEQAECYSTSIAHNTWCYVLEQRGEHSGRIAAVLNYLQVRLGGS
jgi:hypothetical protein